MTYALTKEEYFEKSISQNYTPTVLDVKNFHILATRVNSMIADYIKSTKDANIVLTSGHRTIEHNLSIGGSKHSLHCKSSAVDFNENKIASWYNAQSFDYKQLMGLCVANPLRTPKHSHFDIQRRFDNREDEEKILDGIYRVFNP